MSRRRRDARGVERGPGTLICCAWGGGLGGRGAELRLLEGRTCVYVGYTWLGWESTEALLTTLPENRYAELWQLLHETHFLQIRGLHREAPAEDAGDGVSH